MKILVADEKINAVTGGEVYNCRFYEKLETLNGEKLHYTGRIVYNYSGLKKLLMPLRELKFLKQIISYDVVIWSFSMMNRHCLLLILSKIFGRQKNVTIVHHFQYEQQTGIKRLLYYLQERLFLFLCDEAVIPNAYPLEKAKKFCPHKKLFYIPLPLGKKDIQAAPEKGRLLFAGTIEARKGILYLLEVLKILKQRQIPFFCDIVGKISSEDYYRQCIDYVTKNELEDVVKFHGFVTKQELDTFYKRSEIFVFPSQLEGHGMVITEAMQYGCPCVAFNNSAMPYTIKNGIDGILVKHNDTEAFADAVEDLLKNPAKRQQLYCGMKQSIAELPGEEGFEQGVEQYYQVLCLSR